ncbi:MAG: UPF0182 family protein [Sandaracinaceae bacterium]|nr:UPF0182 family protein [Sandaracinaceae bacterium]
MQHYPEREPPRPGLALSFLLAALVLAVFLPLWAGLYTDLRWFRSLGHGSVFATILRTRLTVGGISGLAFAGFLYAQGRLALRLSARFASPRPRTPNGLATPPLDLGNWAPRIVAPVSILAGVVYGLIASQSWEVYAQYVQGVAFGRRDPLFGHDLAFYFFDLPALHAVFGATQAVVVLSGILVAAVYALRGGVVLDVGKLRAHRRVRIHASVLLAGFLVLLALGAWLDRFELVYSAEGPVAGASYADVHARLPALAILSGVAVLAALLVLVSGWRQGLLMVGAALGLVIATDLLAVRIYPAIVERFSVQPNEAQREAPFIAYNIEATRHAFGLDQVIERDLNTARALTAEDIANNQATLDNVRLWDHRELLDTFAQIQEIRTYYDFTSVDNDRYMVNGQLRQIMLSPRELQAEALPSRTWINEHFTFTHGYGLTLGPVNQTTPEGLPVLYVQDIPPQSAPETGITVTRPAIYFGELSNDHVFVRTRNDEFDHPAGEENVYTTYTGRAGVRLDSFWTQLLVGLRLGQLKLLLSNDITEDSRVLLYRNIRTRAERIAPFLTFDRDPYMVVRDNGTLSWVLDAYTRSDRYPFAQPLADGTNYMRNSVKVIIDAYDGTVDFYVNDDADPVLATYRHIFPELFRDLSEMPEDLQRHLRYPLDLFGVQTRVFTTYHMNEPELVYNREDQWEVPQLTRADASQPMSPYYTVMRLPEEEREEFILMLPYSPKRKENLAAWMVARSDGEHRGELIVYRLPRDRLVFGPQQIMNRIHQDAEISRQVSLWDQRGSQALFGTLLVIPIEESLLYVAPLYLRSARDGGSARAPGTGGGGRIPELKRVIVVYQNQIVMEQTLDLAIARLFGAPVPTEVEAGETEAPAAHDPRPDSVEARHLGPGRAQPHGHRGHGRTPPGPQQRRTGAGPPAVRARPACSARGTLGGLRRGAERAGRDARRAARRSGRTRCGRSITLMD